ncbi:DUF3397 domain-containing protein [Sediminibacillus albus]|uniref:DUF3397 domain-containing protein n=1 Tax=Sediminibacillus albus TaxID=407036 RepID=A0A1G8W7W7_9BACI|nr:DUF3397 domain-containing protein [Sediminibacillus albus]SDJ74392.1 Protein of unknown function [Sediminibacillus albus]
MLNSLAYILAFMITLPVVVSWIVYKVALKSSRNKLKALHTTVNYTTILYILSVGFILNSLLEKNHFGIIFIFLLVSLCISTIVQWKTKDEVLFRFAWKGFWRFSFLLFALLYFVLIIYGITVRILSV